MTRTTGLVEEAAAAALKARLSAMTPTTRIRADGTPVRFLSHLRHRGHLDIPRSPPYRRSMLRSAVFTLVVAAGILLGGPPAGASTSPGVVISQAYGGGGNLGAVYTNDFVELHNTGGG